MTELLGCPFCGGNDLIRGVRYAKYSDTKDDAIRCQACDCNVPLKAWNARHVAQEVDELRLANTFNEAQLKRANDEIARLRGLAQAAPEPEGIQWRRVNSEPFEYAIQQGNFGDEFVMLFNNTCLRRALVVPSTTRATGPLVPWELDCQRAVCAAPECACPALPSTMRRGPCQCCGETKDLKCGPSRFGAATWACADCWEPDGKLVPPAHRGGEA